MNLLTTVSLSLPLTTPAPAEGAIGAGWFDEPWMRAVNAFARATPWLHAALYSYATYGVAVFALLLLAGWWTARRGGDPTRVAAALWAGIGTVVAVGINQPIVNAVHEPRPYSALPHLLVLADRSSDFSFPSDHAIMAGAVVAGVFLVRASLGWVAVVAAVLIAFARVYIGAHYPHDVAAGLLLGAAVVLIGWTLLRAVLTAAVRWLARTPLRPLLTATSPATGTLRNEAGCLSRSVGRADPSATVTFGEHAAGPGAEHGVRGFHAPTRAD